MSYNNDQKLIIFSAPSGAGKTTLVKYLLKEIETLAFSISCTTREKRDIEINGKDYYFISVEEFEEKIKQNAFVEYEEVYEAIYYGTLHAEVQRIFEDKKHVIFDIDVEGGINIKKQYPNAISIFVAPPSKEELKNRLTNRNTESEESLKMRVNKSIKELDYEKHFDYVLVNDDLETAKMEALNLVQNYISQ